MFPDGVPGCPAPGFTGTGFGIGSGCAPGYERRFRGGLRKCPAGGGEYQRGESDKK